MVQCSGGGRKPGIFTLILWVFLASFGASQSAHAEGYWTCADGAWIAVGQPRHAMPSKTCGSQLEMPGTRAACEEAGGRWDKFGLFPREICRVPTHDGGRTCADTDECEGTCLASLTRAQVDLLRKHKTLKLLGNCTPHAPVFGCMALVEKGIVSRMLCRD